MDTLLAHSIARKLERLHKQLLPVSKRTAKRAKKSFRALCKKFQRDSMLNMGRPAHYKPIPLLAGEREKKLFAAHDKRKAAGWIRG